jgi:hypothetical protein
VVNLRRRKEGVIMSEERLIHHMQTWLFRNAQLKWNKSPEETSEIFKQYGLFEYIKECYDYLHLSSYNLALEELETLLKNKGAKIAYE